MTDQTPDGAVAWQWRSNWGTGWTDWADCSDQEFNDKELEYGYYDPANETEYRALIPAASLDAMRADIAALRSAGLYTANRLVEAESKLAAVGAERDVLRAFANDVMEEWWEGDLDGGSRQDIAERHGLIAPQEVTEPCSDTCVCAEVDAFPLMCFRRTELLTGTLIAEAGAGEGGT